MEGRPEEGCWAFVRDAMVVKEVALSQLDLPLF